MEAKLIVVGGKQAGKKSPCLGLSFVIGRAEECQMLPAERPRQPPPLRDFSRRGGAGVRDFGSKNGTFVNDERLQGERELKNGDHVKVGPLEFEVQLSVSVSGKKKPKVHNVQEAAARTVESAPGDELDVSNWLEDEDEEADDLTETHSVPSAPAADSAAEKPPEKPKEKQPVAKWDDETKKRKGSFLDNEPEQKKTAEAVAMRPPTCLSSFSIAGRDVCPSNRRRDPFGVFRNVALSLAMKARPTKKSAALLGLAFDHEDGQTRITRGKNFLLCGGSHETHAVMQETAVKINERLDQRGKRLEDVSIGELRDICRDVRDSVGQE